MDLIVIKQIAFTVYCLIVPFLLTIVGIGIIYIKIKDDIYIDKSNDCDSITRNKIENVINNLNDRD